MNFDLLIRNGDVFDGETAEPRRIDVGVKDGRILRLGDLSSVTAAEDIDATGLTVSPGFIDAHTHSDFIWRLDEPHEQNVALASVRQGVTTQVAGNCGFTAFPSGTHADELEAHIQTLWGRKAMSFDSLAGLVNAVPANRLNSNLGFLVGHGALRIGVMGTKADPPDPDELRRMVAGAEHVLDEGALGISGGLVYAPGSYSTTDELVALATVAAARQKPFALHIRGETHNLLSSVSEAIDIGRRTGASVHISHHKAAGKQNWGMTSRTLEMIEAANEDGVDVSLDVYPYTAGNTILYSLLPPWAQEGDVAGVLELVSHTLGRDRIRAFMASPDPEWENLLYACGWNGIQITTCAGDPDVEGLTIQQIADARGMDPLDAFCDLLIRSECVSTASVHMIAEPDIHNVLRYPRTMIGSDGTPLPGKPHPRWAGTFARVLGEYRRERGLFGLGTAIAKMTGLPAKRFGLEGRGVVREGAHADLCVFDATSVADRATFAEPLLSPVGIVLVVVDGKVSVRNDIVADGRHGQVIGSGNPG